jgi:hypothetical protein
VRTRLGSDTYGDGVWGDWHRTEIVATTARVDYGSPRASLHPHNVKIPTAPRITAPSEGQVFHGSVRYSFLLPPHTSHANWSCCSVQWKRAVIVTAENNAYAQVYTPGHTAFPTPPMPAKGAGLNHKLMEQGSVPGSVYSGTFAYLELRPHDRTSGYRYWFRVRERYLPTKQDGPWSAWRSVDVQEAASSPKRFPRMNVRSGASHSNSSGQQQHSHRMTIPLPQMQIRR